MANTTWYGDGLSTVAVGSRTVTGTDTGWLTEVAGLTPIKAGDKYGIHVGRPIVIERIISDTELLLADDWPGPAQTDATYKVELTSPTIAAVEAMRRLLASLSDGNLDSLSEITVGTDDIPIGIGPGVFGTIKKFELKDGVQFDEAVATLAERSAYDAAAKDFRVLVANIGDGRAAVYIKESSTSGDWSVPYPITGGVGPSGPYTEITIGPTTTLPAGSSATVTPVVIDADTVRLDFGLPKGLDGTGTGDVVGPNGGTTAKQVAGFGSTTGKAIVGLTAAEVRSYAAVPISNFRNKLMNALGALNTRNVSGTVTLAAGAFGHDRMKAGASGCTYTFAASNGVTTFTITAGSLQHTVESRAFAGQAGRYWLSWSGTAQGRINGGSYGASGAVFADIDASSNVTVEFNTGTLSLPQLELDYVSAFSGRPQDVEEMMCRRYLPGIRSDSSGGMPTFGFATTNSQAVFTVPFLVRARVKPTGVGVVGAGAFTTFAAEQSVTGWAFGQASEVGGEIAITTSGSGYTPSHAGWLRASGGALNIYFTGADL